MSLNVVGLLGFDPALGGGQLRHRCAVAASGVLLWACVVLWAGTQTDLELSTDPSPTRTAARTPGAAGRAASKAAAG